MMMQRSSLVSLLFVAVLNCCSGAFQYSGINMAGLEFGTVCDAIPPVGNSIDFFRQQGHNMFRIPFTWEKLTSCFGCEFDATHLALLKADIKVVTDSGAIAILDCHSYYHWTLTTSANGTPLTSRLLTAAADANNVYNFWVKLVKEFPDANIWYGLMNEPYDLTTEDVKTLHQSAINGIRSTGQTNKIIVSGNGWDSMQTWTSNCWYGTCNSLMSGLTDSANNFIYEMHMYFDSGNTGTLSDCTTLDMVAVAATTNWLKANNKQAMLSEFGIPNNANCVNNYAEVLLNYLDSAEAAGAWIGYNVWGAGPCFDDGNILTLDPKNGATTSDIRLVMLARHAGTATASKSGDSAVPTAVPVQGPTAVPSAVPTAVPSAVPSIVPSAVPTVVPTAVPSAVPSAIPTAIPSAVPIRAPTGAPHSPTPSAAPSVAPSMPTQSPTVTPTRVPHYSEAPSVVPSAMPSAAPVVSSAPTPAHEIFTMSPSVKPSVMPTRAPTASMTTMSFGASQTITGVSAADFQGSKGAKDAFKSGVSVPAPDGTKPKVAIKGAKDTTSVTLKHFKTLTASGVVVNYNVSYVIHDGQTSSAVYNNFVTQLTADLTSGAFTTMLHNSGVPMFAAASSDASSLNVTTYTQTTTGEQPTDSNDNSVDNAGFWTVGAIVGVAIGGFVLLVLILCAICFCAMRPSSSSAPPPALEAKPATLNNNHEMVAAHDNSQAV